MTFLTLIVYFIRYELRAVQLARLRQMTNENENAPNTSAYEVEMSETKQSTSDLDSVTHDIESGKEWAGFRLFLLLSELNIYAYLVLQ